MAACIGETADWNAASRNTAVSNPSRMTARKAITTSAAADPLARALPAAFCRSDFRPRECARIQSTM